MGVRAGAWVTIAGRRLAIGLALLAACDQSASVHLPVGDAFEADRGREARPDGGAAAVEGWAVALGGPGVDGVAAIALAPDGNLVITGDFHGIARFGEQTLMATGPEGGGVFVAKLDTSGRVLWATGLQADARMAKDLVPRLCLLNDLAVDAAGNIVVTTHFTGTVAIGGTILTAQGEMDALVVKLDVSGHPLWARGLGGAGPDLIQGVAVDAEGAITVTGMFDGAADFGGVKRVARGLRDSFVARLTPDGTVRWAVQAGSEAADTYPGANSWEYGFGLALDGSGNTYVAGKFVDKASLGDFTLTAIPKYGYSIYLAKLDANGEFVRAEAAPEQAAELVRPRRLALEPSGRLRLTGSIAKGAMRFPFVATVGLAQEAFAWSFAAVPMLGEGTAVVASGGETAVTGIMSQGSAVVGSTTIQSAGGNDVYVARLGAANEFTSAARAGGPGDDGGNSVIIDQAGNLYVAGWFSGEAGFRKATLTSAGEQDGFVWKIPLGEP